MRRIVIAMISAVLIAAVAATLAADRRFPPRAMPVVHTAAPIAADFICTPVPRPPAIDRARTRGDRLMNAHFILVLVAVAIALAAVIKERSLAAIGLLFLTLILLVLP